MVVVADSFDEKLEAIVTHLKNIYMYLLPYATHPSANFQQDWDVKGCC